MNTLEATLEELAKEEAMATILSDFGDMKTDEILTKLSEGEVPDEILVWEVFEHYDAQSLLEVFNSFEMNYFNFGQRVLGVKE